ncbi:UBX domain-containing protein 2A [Hyperolius riggenbachi]|uniref:UBX domain-containing protein 2A n=1 Tax=Hyperolius riggenbachi TaxID=752182 RepID=UPI0035A333D1
MREADSTDKMKPQDRSSRGMGGERKRCDSFVNSLFEEANDAGVPNASPEDEAKVVIRMWKNGFTIDDGQLRDYTDAANRQFMDSVRKGELPSELQRTFEKKEVAVNVVDRKGEEFAFRKKHVEPFSGRGYRLGSATPTVVTKAMEDGLSLPDVELNELEPSTDIKIWLADGNRIVQKFNTTHRISDVRHFLEKMPRMPKDQPFSLATSFPLCDLMDETLSLQEAHLYQAVLVQRLQKTAQPFRDS